MYSKLIIACMLLTFISAAPTVSQLKPRALAAALGDGSKWKNYDNLPNRPKPAKEAKILPPVVSNNPLPVKVEPLQPNSGKYTAKRPENIPVGLISKIPQSKVDVDKKPMTPVSPR